MTLGNDDDLGATLALPEDSKRDDAEHKEDVRQAGLLAHDMADLTPGYFWNPRYLGTIISLSLTTASAYFGFSAPASVLSYINEDIGPTDSESLFSIVWTMCNAISLLVVGRVSDRFGKRYIMLGAGALAMVGAVVASRAENMNTLIGANVLLGLASGVHSAVGLFAGGNLWGKLSHRSKALTRAPPEISPNRYKFMIQTAILIPMVISPGLGAYIGRACVETHSWRWIYYILIVILGVGWVIQMFVYFPPTFEQLHGKQRSILRELQRIDQVGLLLLIAGLTLFLLGISWGGNPKPWHSGLILGLLISGGVTLVVFVLWEAFYPTPNPIVDLRLFKHRGFVCLTVISACSGSMYVGLSIIWPQYVFRVFSAASTSWQTEAWMSSTVGWGIWGGLMIMCPLVNVIGNLRLQILGCVVFSTVFLIALSQVGIVDRSQAIAFSFLTGLPVGFIELGPCVICQLGAPDQDIGMVFGTISCIRSVAGSIFTAIYIAVLNSKARSEIASRVPQAAVEAGLPQSSLMSLFDALKVGSEAAIASVPGMTTQIEAAVIQAERGAYSHAFRYVYYSAMPLLGCAIIASIFLPDYNRYMNGHMPKPINMPNAKVASGTEGESPGHHDDTKSTDHVEVEEGSKHQSG